ncbi:hypothetical protein Leryth_003259 [Lithospermum erythrorhizon]|nr:hypothetical protein Leryth_003259 [Lithospermum erythrorhizon]
MASLTLSISTSNPTRIPHLEHDPLTLTRNAPWLGSIVKLSIHNLNMRAVDFTKLPIKATVSFSLPTAKPERIGSEEKVPKWSEKAIKSFAMSELEARKLRYPSTGTEALIMGIFIEGTNFASKFLRANGITFSKVREEIIKLSGIGDRYFFSPEHPPLTEDAQRALDWAFDEKLKSGDNGEITTSHLLLGVWYQEESPGHKVLAALGLNSEKVKELESSVSEPGFVEN